jgi:hypothetical protein
MVVNKQVVETALDLATYAMVGMAAYALGKAIVEQRQTLDQLRDYIERVERDFLFIASAPKADHESATSSDTVVPDVS